MNSLDRQIKAKVELDKAEKYIKLNLKSSLNSYNDKLNTLFYIKSLP